MNDQYELAWQILEGEIDPYTVDPSEEFYAEKGSSMSDVEDWNLIFAELENLKEDEQELADIFLEDKVENSWTEYCDVNSPNHYKSDSGLESIDVIDAFVPDSYSFYMGNVVKYTLRHMDKGTAKKDLRKAKWYLERMIEDWE